MKVAARPGEMFWSEIGRKSRLPWNTLERFVANAMEARLLERVPAQWRPRLELLRQDGGRQAGQSHYVSWIDRMRAFEDRHGEVLQWAVSDSTVCARARAIADDIKELMSAWPVGLDEAERIGVLRSVCGRIDVDLPSGKTPAGIISRGCSEHWWRAALRKKVARVVEHAAIKLGVVHRKNGGYASDEACSRRRQQLQRNEALLKRTLVRNEAGQVYTLAELAAASVSNRDNRRGELMTRIRGCEEFADARGHIGIFLTLTCPSRFHAVLSGGQGAKARPRANPRYMGATPREGQEWLCDKWARTRSALQRRKVAMYGFRVAEPHHDGCPHWHVLLWCHDEAAAQQVEATVRRYWLADAGDEPGAQKNRVDFKRMEAGGAAGYVAKYVAKNIGAEDGSDAGLGLHLDGLEVDTREYKGFQRVDAWASTWGIRQFQPFGQPPVVVWREMRRVTKDQIDSAQLRLDFGDEAAVKAWHACQRSGAVLADWNRYAQAQGGMCRKRAAWALRPAVRVVPQVKNLYGEEIERKTVVGVELASGRWLVSRRQGWKRLVDGESCAQSAEERAALARPWTGFNNCTARIGRETLRTLLMGDAPWPKVHDTTLDSGEPPPRPAPKPAPNFEMRDAAIRHMPHGSQIEIPARPQRAPVTPQSLAARFTPEVRAAMRAAQMAGAAEH